MLKPPMADLIAKKKPTLPKIDFKHGGPRDVWQQNAPAIAGYIESNGLATEVWLSNGGYPGAHVHLGNTVCRMTAEAWREVSAKMTANTTQKTGTAGKIAFK